MTLDPDHCYQALLTHDARFDGAFFVGVATTGIYCRTVCTAKTPRRENCAFYPSAAAAERAGFRPCLRCRPELAPGNARIDALSRLAADAAGRIEDGALTEGSVADLAGEMGVSDRHLRRVIESEFGVSPVELAQTQRLLLAKRLLTDTALPIGEIAFASGFSSLRRFNALFQERYRLNPTDLRKITRGRERPAGDAGLRSRLSPAAGLGLAADIPGRAARPAASRPPTSKAATCERSASGKRRGWLAAAPMPGKNALRVEVSASLAPALLPTLARVRRLFDLAAAPAADRRASRPAGRCPSRPARSRRVRRLRDGRAGHSGPAGQRQGRVHAGRPVRRRVRRAIWKRRFAALTHLLPDPGARGGRHPWTRSRSSASSARGPDPSRAGPRRRRRANLTLEPGGDVEETMAQLKALPGIGEWTAQYVAMRALAWPDAFPHTDLGIVKALGEKNPRRVSGDGRSLASLAGLRRHAPVEIFGENPMTTYYTYCDSPIQPLLLTSDGAALTGLYMADHKHGPEIAEGWVNDGRRRPFAESEAAARRLFRGRADRVRSAARPAGNARSSSASGTN